jgi:glycolate oxidase FAD binding subunit
MARVVTPASEQEVVDIVRDLTSPVSIVGSGTRAGLGRPIEAADVLSTRALDGIAFYEPAEMMMSVRAGTPVPVVEQALEARGQMLPFEPADHRRLYGTDGTPTFGAVAACNISGPRRIQAGAARDSIVGLRFVNGRGEIVKSGGRVMKNVTGLDLVKLYCGSYGSLGILTEITFKVLPKPERASTLELEGLDDASAVKVLTGAMGSPFEVSGAAHLPAYGAEPPRTLLRLEGTAASVRDRMSALQAVLVSPALSRVLADEETAALWRDIRDGVFVAAPAGNVLWRVSVKPTQGPALIAALADVPLDRYFFDWSGGLIWMSVPPAGDAGAGPIRAALSELGGHATVIRAPDEIRRNIDVFQPLPGALMKITSGIKLSSDPRRLLNPGIMYPGI